MKRQVINYTEREGMIMEYMRSHAFASTQDVSTLTGVSLATVRRDFEKMTRNGLIHRAHGGVRTLSGQPNTVEACPDPMTVIETPIDAEKAKIAAFAASLVNETESIFIGSGKTCNLLASYLKGIDYLTIVTTSLNAVMELVHKSNISIYLLGGDIYLGNNFIETVIPDNELQAHASMYFDKVFITVDGIDLESGYTIRNRRQIPLYSQLLDSSKEFFLLVDSSKFGRRSFVPVFPADEKIKVVSTSGIPARYVEYYRQKQIQLHVIE